MDRRAWLAERRAAVTASYDVSAPTYDREDYPTEQQPTWVARLLDTCPAGGRVLDAPCGTGRYFAQIVASGRHVVGIDQSAGMLAVAGARGIADSLERVGLQELRFVAEFDASITVDAMENVSPEDWPIVLSNLHRAVRPGGHLYLTVETTDDASKDDAFAALVAQGLPAVRGEWVDARAAGYHFYPERDQVFRWLEAEALDVVDEAHSAEGEHWGYLHLLLHSCP